MSRPTAHEQVQQLIQQMQSNLPEAPAGMEKSDYDALCQAIARTMVMAMQQHEQRYHQINPEFGEIGRDGDDQ